LREYITAIREKAVEKDSLTDELQNWLKWATDKVDWYDPLINWEDVMMRNFDKDKLI